MANTDLDRILTFFHQHGTAELIWLDTPSLYAAVARSDYLSGSFRTFAITRYSRICDSTCIVKSRVTFDVDLNYTFDTSELLYEIQNSLAFDTLLVSYYLARKTCLSSFSLRIYKILFGDKPIVTHLHEILKKKGNIMYINIYGNSGIDTKS